MALADDLARDLGLDAEANGAELAFEPVKSRAWLCCTCGHLRTCPMPAVVAAPCVRCDGVDFETVPDGTVVH